MTEGDVYRSRSILALNETIAIVSSTTTENPSNTTINNGQKNCTKAAILELPSDGYKNWFLLNIL